MLFDSQYRDLKNYLPWHRIQRMKDALRGIDAQKRRIHTSEQVHADSHQIVAHLEEMDCFKQAQTIMVYYPMDNEVDLRSLVKKYADQKTFLLPCTSLRRRKIKVRTYVKGAPLKKGAFGIPEPSTPIYKGKIDLIIVPGIAYDLECHRLGRGGGCYDRFLKNFKKSIKIGVCYDFQLHDVIPHNFFDKSMDWVVTPSKTIEK